MNKEKSLALIILGFIGMFLFDVFTNVFSDFIGDTIKPIFFGSDPPAAVTAPVDPATPQETAPPQQADTDPGTPVTEVMEIVEPENPDTTASAAPTFTPSDSSTTDPTSAVTPPPPPEPEPETVDPLSQLENITGQTSLSGHVTEKGQINQYLYTAPTDGLYRFDSGLSFGALNLQVDNEYGGKMGSGSASMEVELTAGKSYILNVAYANKPIDYTIQIGVPNPIVDITGQTSASGALTYLGQQNKYLYIAPVDGLYLFDSGMNFNSVRLSISNEYGGKIRGGSASTEAELTAGKTYLLTVEYSATPLDYIIQIYVPNPILDITGQSSVPGSLTYYCQRNRYLYTAPADGTYVFDTGLDFGSSIYVELDDANGGWIDRKLYALTADLKSGTTYMINVYRQYSSGLCDYNLSITMQ